MEKRSDGYFIAGIAEKSGKPTVAAVRVGDKLIQVDNVLLSSATRGAGSLVVLPDVFPHLMMPVRPVVPALRAPVVQMMSNAAIP